MEESSQIENAQIIDDNSNTNVSIGTTSTPAGTEHGNEGISSSNSRANLEIHTLFYIFGIILMLLVYIGPFIYFKYYKRKNFVPGTSMGVKHAI